MNRQQIPLPASVIRVEANVGVFIRQGFAMARIRNSQRIVSGSGIILLAGVICLLISPSAARALINPKFTPVHLTEQSATILTLKAKGKEVGDKLVFNVQAGLKGKSPGTITLDLSKAEKPQADEARRQLGQFAAEPALFFAGEYLPTSDEPGPAAKSEGARAYIHIHGKWFKAAGGKDDVWDLQIVDSEMLGTWNGGTDMLIRCVQYLLADKADATVPVEPGITWKATKKIGRIAGQARDIAAVDLADDGKLCLFIAADKGDRLFKPVKDGFEEITEKVKLQSTSQLSAWGDFTGSGKVSLASFDGKTLTIWTPGADGAFAATKVANLPALPAKCVGMATIGLGRGKPTGLLVSPAAGQPVLLKPDGKGGFEAVALAAPVGPVAQATKDFGQAGACLVADFNNDSFIDIIQPFEKGGLIYLGNKDGGFDAPKPCGVCLSIGGGKAVVGDFAGDGLLDILVAGAEGVAIFQNLGDTTFADSLGLSGEVAYKGQPHASWCGVCDFNSDSRRGLFLTYPNQNLLLYFNRGFRSFGQSPKLELSLADIADCAKGQQMALFADFADSGVQDMVLITNSGEVWCAFNDGGGGDAKAVKVRLPAGQPDSFAGPVNVSLWKGKRSLGAAPVQVGGPAAFFGVQDAGLFTVKWTLPGGKEVAKQVRVVDKPVIVTVDEGR